MKYKDLTEEQKQRIRERRMAYYYASRTPENRAKESDRAAAWQKANPDKARANMRAYRVRNGETIAARSRAWRDSNREHFNARVLAWHKARPWYKSWQSARQRCVNPNATGYEFYGGRGIEFHLTEADVKAAWLRDNAAALRLPSIDRIDADGHYTPENIRFIEQSENSRRGKYSGIERRRQAYLRAREAERQAKKESKSALTPDIADNQGDTLTARPADSADAGNEKRL